jgi:hypothetical protein
MKFDKGKKTFLTKIIETSTRGVTRFVRRMEMIGELGWDEGREVPLSVNIMAIATK